MRWYKHLFFLILIIVFIIPLQGCNSNSENVLFGKWVSEDIVLVKVNANYKEIQLEFSEYAMKIDNKEIPVLYKIKEKDRQVLLFSKGEKLIVHLMPNDEIILFLRNIGKRKYIRQK